MVLLRCRERGRIVVGLSLCLLCVLLALLGYLIHSMPGRLQRKEVLGRTQSVVRAVRDLARLETAEYHIERVIDLREEQRRLFGLIEGEDAVLLVAAGDVTAGVDLARLAPGDVQLDEKARVASLRLPQPEIFHSRLDENNTYVHTRRTDLLAARSERLEGRARALAVDSFERAARDSGILDRARSQAERVLRPLLRELGVVEVRISWR